MALVVLASYSAMWLRFDDGIPPEVSTTYLHALPALIAIRGLVFIPFGLYGGLWRYTSIWDLYRIVLAVFTSTGVFWAFVSLRWSIGTYPRSMIIIDSLLLVCFLGGVRLLRRVLPAALHSSHGRRVVILGAGDAGEMIVREMRKAGRYNPVGFVDDDLAKVGRTIHGVTVLGTRNDLSLILDATRPDEILVAIPSATAATVRSIVHLLERYKLPITTLPSLAEIVNGQVGVKQIRPLAIADLLPRSQVSLDTAAARRLIHGKRVLVTGAGGSIGSELCRQIAKLEPASLVLFERYENSLYTVANELTDKKFDTAVQPAIGDVTDASRVESVFAAHRPQIVFHAAAHKHVPLMEANPCEAVKNNIAGTQVLAEFAKQYGAERFVLISTDKAANPSSVMGATKRVAELIVQAASAEGPTRFVTVRFGNVLGSNGSVIPRMMGQIQAGGPVTVTHPEIRRYFMLIPEAVQLVLQAAVLARNRETFVLDMGEQIKVLDVARNLIRLAGFVPDEEIPITFIGLRPGEKLVEELVGTGEVLEPATEKLFRVRWPVESEWAATADRITRLLRKASQGEAEAVIHQLREIVPTFTPREPLPLPVVSRDEPVRLTGRRPLSVDAPIGVAVSAPPS